MDMTGGLRFGMLAQALLRNRSLQHLNIARNRITELSALLLKVHRPPNQHDSEQDMLVGTPNLTSVALDGNPIGELGGRMMMLACAQVPTKEISFVSCSFAEGDSLIALFRLPFSGEMARRGFKMDDPTGSYKLETWRVSDRSILSYLGTLATEDAEKSAKLECARSVVVSNAVLDGKAYNLDANWGQIPEDSELSFDLAVSQGI